MSELAAVVAELLALEAPSPWGVPREGGVDFAVGGHGAERFICRGLPGAESVPLAPGEWLVWLDGLLVLWVDQHGAARLAPGWGDEDFETLARGFALRLEDARHAAATSVALLQARFEFDERAQWVDQGRRAVRLEVAAVLDALATVLRWLSLELLDQDDNGSGDVWAAVLEAHYMRGAVVRLAHALEDHCGDGAT